ncbi:MAG: CPBP family intramembrane glutamic endopeptidase, partial [Oscillospiraceae bacterium]
ICCCLLLYFFCKDLFILPCTYLAYYMGFDVTINHYTNMILKSEIATQAIIFFANISAMIISVGLMGLFCSQNLKFSKLFQKPHKGTLLISLPIIIAVGILGEVVAVAFGKTTSSFGLVFTRINPINISNDKTTILCTMIFAVIIVIAQELIFRGIILYSLRHFSDSFAIITSSVLFALFQDGIIEIIASFLFGLALSYFTIRSSSLYTAIVSRTIFVVILYLVSISFKYLQYDNALIISLTFCILIFIISGLSLIKFAKRDKNAFVLKKPSCNISLRKKIVAFHSTGGFVLFTLLICFHILLEIQIIG